MKLNFALRAGFAAGLLLVVAIVVFLVVSEPAKVQAIDSTPIPQPALMEKLGRSLVAVRRSGDIYVGWRLLGTDPAGTAFNLYRSTNGGEAVKINSDPITVTTDYVDSTADLSASNSYFVRPVINGVEVTDSNTFTVGANAPVQQYLSVPLQRPAGGTSQQAPGNTTGQSAYTYAANDASVADLDGDGVYEIILKWDPSNARDNASAGLSGPVIIDAYKMDGTLMWRVDLGKNIRSGAHYTQFMVYDLDGDGKAEMVCKTADGSVDGNGAVIGDGTKDWRSLTIPSDSSILAPATNDQRYGKILDGPEYLTVFNGETGTAMANANYVPTRYPLDSWGGVGGNGNNDTTGNRVDRFTAAVAYLDGVRPSVVMARGYYGRSVLAAWDWRGGQLTQRWVFDSENRANPFSGQGAHSLSVADVDADGKDEIVYHAMTVDNDGTGLYSTGLRHGDATHVSDLIPSRPGLEVFGVHETESTTNPAFQSPASSVHDARTGEIIWTNPSIVDAGRGLCADIDPNFPGQECWGGPGGTRNASSVTPIYSQAPGPTNFAVWWDADLSRELEDQTSISKWNPTTRTVSTLLNATGAASNNGTKATPSITADLLGDWREEVMWRSSDNLSLRIYTTTIPANNRLYTLMHNRQYRMAIAWQNVAYNQPPHPDYFIGTGMTAPPAPNIITALVPPTITAADVTAEATSASGAPVIFSASAADLIGTSLPVTYSIAPGSTFPIGTTPVTVSTTDIYGTTATAILNVTVVDSTAPSINTLTASPNEIWPPNHKMVNVSLTANVTDAVDGTPFTRIVSVTSNQPINGPGDGNTDFDWQITGNMTLQVRAERAQGNDRIYTITVESTDDAGNSSTRTVNVRVGK